MARCTHPARQPSLDPLACTHHLRHPRLDPGRRVSSRSAGGSGPGVRRDDGEGSGVLGRPTLRPSSPLDPFQHLALAQQSERRGGRSTTEKVVARCPHRALHPGLDLVGLALTISTSRARPGGQGIITQRSRLWVPAFAGMTEWIGGSEVPERPPLRASSPRTRSGVHIAPPRLSERQSGCRPNRGTENEDVARRTSHPSSPAGPGPRVASHNARGTGIGCSPKYQQQVIP